MNCLDAWQCNSKSNFCFDAIIQNTATHLAYKDLHQTYFFCILITVPPPPSLILTSACNFMQSPFLFMTEILTPPMNVAAHCPPHARISWRTGSEWRCCGRSRRMHWAEYSVKPGPQLCCVWCSATKVQENTTKEGRTDSAHIRERSALWCAWVMCQSWRSRLVLIQWNCHLDWFMD